MRFCVNRYSSPRGHHEDLATVTVNGGGQHCAVRIARRYVSGCRELRHRGPAPSTARAPSTAAPRSPRRPASSSPRTAPAPTRAVCRASSSPTSPKTFTFSRRLRGRRQRAGRAADDRDAARRVSAPSPRPATTRAPRRGRRGPDLGRHVQQHVRPARQRRAPRRQRRRPVLSVARTRPRRRSASAARTRSRSTSSAAARTSSSGRRAPGRPRHTGRDLPRLRRQSPRCSPSAAGAR